MRKKKDVEYFGASPLFSRELFNIDVAVENLGVVVAMDLQGNQAMLRNCWIRLGVIDGALAIQKSWMRFPSPRIS